MKNLKEAIGLAASFFFWPLVALWRGRKMEAGSKEEVFFLIGFLYFLALVALAAISYVCRQPFILWPLAFFHPVGWVGYRSYRRHYLLERQPNLIAEKDIRPMAKWQIWLDDVARVELLSVWRSLTGGLPAAQEPGQPVNWSGMANSRENQAQSLAARRHLSIRRADELYPRVSGLTEMSQRVAARLAVD